MSARIYSPSKTAMQSGTARTGHWVLEFEPLLPLSIDPLMGYTSSADTRRQVRLNFPTKDEAIAYARKNGLAFYVEEAHKPRRLDISYADNFRYDRKVPWTH